MLFIVERQSKNTMDLDTIKIMAARQTGIETKNMYKVLSQRGGAITSAFLNESK
jgi:hypothetical protein